MEVLEPLRREIDAIDDRIVDLLAQRQGIVRRVAAIKGRHGIPVLVPERIDQVKERNAARAATQGLDPDFIRRLYDLVIEAACAEEHGLIDTAPGPAAMETSEGRR